MKSNLVDAVVSFFREKVAHTNAYIVYEICFSGAKLGTTSKCPRADESPR